MRGISVLVAGAGLAGLSGARELARKGAKVTVIDARDRVGGRVCTAHEPFLHGEHAEMGADLIESQTEICKLISDAGLRTATILPGGFASVKQDGERRRVGGRGAPGRSSARCCSPKCVRFASASSDGMAASQKCAFSRRSRRALAPCHVSPRDAGTEKSF